MPRSNEGVNKGLGKEGKERVGKGSELHLKCLLNLLCTPDGCTAKYIEYFRI